MASLPNAAASSGLSPLARRNQLQLAVQLEGMGPISAGAEEPGLFGINVRLLRAYLRWRGGTAWLLSVRQVGGGLSPLARRNLALQGSHTRGQGPISAGAEEP